MEKDIKFCVFLDVHCYDSIKNKIGDDLTLIDRIDHHYTTGISTVETASKNSKLLNDEFKKYFQNNNAKYATYALKGEFDKIAGLKKLLDTHHIPYEHPKAKVNIKGWDYENQKNRTISFESDALILNAQGKKGEIPIFVE